MLLSPFADDIVDLVIEEKGLGLLPLEQESWEIHGIVSMTAGITVIPVVPSSSFMKRMEKLGCGCCHC